MGAAQDRHQLISSTRTVEVEGVGTRPVPTAPAPRVHQPSAHPHAASVHAGGGRPGRRSETGERSTARRGPTEPKELELRRAGHSDPGPEGRGSGRLSRVGAQVLQAVVTAYPGARPSRHWGKKRPPKYYDPKPQPWNALKSAVEKRRF